jgi:hypothetical protein
MKAAALLLLLCICCFASDEQNTSDVQLRVLPDHVYKTNDPGHRGTESWYYRLALIDPKDRTWIPKQVVVEFFHGDVRVETQTVFRDELESRRRTSFRVSADTPAAAPVRAFQLPEAFDVWFGHSFPIKLNMDRMHVRMEVEDKDGKSLSRDLEIPLSSYQQKTKLVFPFVGNGLITQGTINDSGHNAFANQYAIDVIGLTPLYAPETCDEDLNSCYAGWGREIIAPADGVVVYARNDVPDNPTTGGPDMKFLGSLHDPVDAVVGNCVIIDHGNSEYSVMMHMQQGSVRVKTNDKVTQGQAIGQLGDSGEAYGPHLHYQLQNAPKLFQSASVPVTFENVPAASLVRGSYFRAKAKSIPK